MSEDLTRKRKMYAVHSIFLTFQGEGYHAGRRAVFIRFSGCNVWSGHDMDRDRDALRNSACAKICDTSFVGYDAENRGGHYTAEDIHSIVYQLWGQPDVQAEEPFIVFTDEELLAVFSYAYTAMETNGTKQLPEGIDWVTLSPKPPMPVVDQHYNEIKVLHPLFNPLDFEKYCPQTVSLTVGGETMSGAVKGRLWVQPVDGGAGQMTNTLACMEFVHKNPKWRMSIQLHKILGIQ
jgi:7-carboxy-7-deazaguanine synthase